MPYPPRSPRSALVQVLLTHQERDTLLVLADNESMSVSGFVRKLIRRAIADRLQLSPGSAPM